MKKLILSISLIVSAVPVFASLTFNAYDVESFQLKSGEVVSASDIQDQRQAIRGVFVNDDQVVVSPKISKDLRSIKLFTGSVIALGGGGGGDGDEGDKQTHSSLQSGDMGGGGMVMYAAKEGGDMGGGGLK